MLAFTALCGEVRKALLEAESEYFDVDVVAELLGHDEEEVPEDDRREQVDDVCATGEQDHARLVNESEECDGRQRVQFDGAELMEDHVEQADVEGEVHVVRGAVRCRQRVEARVLPQVAIWVPIHEQGLREWNGTDKTKSTTAKHGLLTDVMALET